MKNNEVARYISLAYVYLYCLLLPPIQPNWLDRKHMPIRKAVFPVAGMGARLLPATKSQPKEMLPVGYKPVVVRRREMVEQGLSKFLFITGRKNVQ